jgi:ribose transport system permease protein
MSVQSQPGSPFRETDVADRARRVRTFVARNTPQLLLVVLAIVFFIVKPSLFTPGSLTNILLAAAPITVLALGAMWVVIGGGIDFSGSSWVVLCALTLGGLVNAGVPGLVAVLIVLVIGLVLGLFNGFIVGVVGVPAFIATLATYLAGTGVVSMVSTIVGGTVVISDGFLGTLGSGSIGPVKNLVLFAVVICALAWFVARRTTFGLHTYAVGSSRASSAGRGVQMVRQDVLLYMFSGLTIALTGTMLVARTGIVDAEIAGVGTLLDAYAATIIGGTSLFGGRGSVVGTLCGALIIALVSVGLISLGVAAEWVQAVKGATIIIAVVMDSLVRIIEKRGALAAPATA